MLLSVAVAAALFVVPMKSAWAQGEKPMAVVAAQSVDQLMEHMDYLAKAAGQTDQATMARGAVTALGEGMDTTRPLGAIITSGGEPVKLAVFVPVKDMDKLMAAVQEMPGMGPPEDVGDGISRMGGLQPAYIKSVGNWAFVAPEKEFLTDVPADPSALLDGLNEKYAVAVRAYVQNIPAEDKQMMLDLMKEGMAPGMERLPGEGEDEFAVRKKMVENQLEQMQMLMEEMDQLTIGWGVDAQAKQTYFDIEVTAVPGTDLAEETKLVTEAASQFAGFLRDDAAMSAHFVFKAAESDIEEAVTTMQAFRTNAMKEIENQNLGDDAEAAAKEVMELMFDVAEATVKQGKIDGGAVVLLGDSPCFAAGGLVADGQKLDEALRKLAAVAAEEPDFPEIKWDAEVQGTVKLHTMSIPIPEPQAREMFGEELEVVIGTSDSSIYVAAGKNAVTTLKEILVASSARAGEQRMPVEITIALKPILEFAGKFAPPAGMMAGMLEDAGDKLTIVESPIENGARVRITIEEGIIKAAGGAVGMLMTGFGGEEPAFDEDFDDGF
jgi:hypothetical protein